MAKRYWVSVSNDVYTAIKGLSRSTCRSMKDTMLSHIQADTLSGQALMRDFGAAKNSRHRLMLMLDDKEETMVLSVSERYGYLAKQARKFMADYCYTLITQGCL